MASWCRVNLEGLWATTQPIRKSEVAIGIPWYYQRLNFAIRRALGATCGNLQRPVILDCTRENGSKCSKHFIFHGLVLDSLLTSGRQLAQEIGMTIMGDAIRYLRKRLVIETPANPLDTFLTRLIGFHKMGINTFMRQTTFDLAIYRMNGCFRVLGSGKTGFERFQTESGQTRYRVTRGQPLLLEKNDGRGGLIYLNPRIPGQVSYEEWRRSLVCLAATDCLTEEGPGNLIHFRSVIDGPSAYAAACHRAFHNAEGGVSPAENRAEGRSRKRIEIRFGRLKTCLPWYENRSHRLTPKKPYVYKPGRKTYPTITVNPQEIFDREGGKKNIAEFSDGEPCYCSKCEVTLGLDGRPDQAEGPECSAHVWKIFATGSAGWWCWNCETPPGFIPDRGVNYLFKNKTKRIMPRDGITDFRPVFMHGENEINHENDWLSDVLDASVLYNKRLAVIDAYMGSGKTMMLTGVIQKSMRDRHAFKVRYGRFGDVTPVLILVYRVGLATFYLNKYAHLGFVLYNESDVLVEEFSPRTTPRLIVCVPTFSRMKLEDLVYGESWLLWIDECMFTKDMLVEANSIMTVDMVNQADDNVNLMMLAASHAIFCQMAVTVRVSRSLLVLCQLDCTTIIFSNNPKSSRLHFHRHMEV